MLERVPKLVAIVNDPKFALQKAFLAAAIEHQKPLVEELRDGFSQNTRELVARALSRRMKFTRDSLSQVGNPVLADFQLIAGRYTYCRDLLTLPSKPSFDMIEFAIAIGEAFDSLRRQDMVDANFPAEFVNSSYGKNGREIVPQNIALLRKFSLMDCEGAMGPLVDNAKRLRYEYFLLSDLNTQIQTPSEETKSKLEVYGIDITSITVNGNMVSYVQGTCKHTINFGSKIKGVLNNLYTLYLNPMIERLAFGFSPIF